MKFISYRKYVFSLITLVLLSLILLITTSHRGQASSNQVKITESMWSLAQSAAVISGLHPNGFAETTTNVTTPPPEKDNCLHCHVTGENKNLWTPLTRWLVFGTFGLVFVLGVYRSASVWKDRKTWIPLRTKAAEWVDERYEISEPLSKVLNKPVPKYALRWWYCLGGITAFLFVVQAATGILLAFYYKPTPEAAYSSIQFIEEQVRFGAGVRMIRRCTYDPPLGSQWDDRSMRGSHAEGFHHGSVQTTPRTKLGQWCTTLDLNSRIRVHRISAALGSTCLLGDHRWLRDRGEHPRYWGLSLGLFTSWMEHIQPDSQSFLRIACHRAANIHPGDDGFAFSHDPPAGCGKTFVGDKT